MIPIDFHIKWKKKISSNNNSFLEKILKKLKSNYKKLIHSAKFQMVKVIAKEMMKVLKIVIIVEQKNKLWDN